MPRRRWVLILTILPLYTLALMILSLIAARAIVLDDLSISEFRSAVEDVGDALGDSEYWTPFGIFWTVAVGLQVVFLLPVVRNRPPAGDRPKSLIVSLIVGAAIAALLTFGLVAALASGIMLFFDDATFTDGPDWFQTATFLTLPAGWVGWSLALFLFVRGIWADRVLGRMIGVMIGGSILEIVITLPIDIMIRRRTDCYCAEGTFFSLTASAFALLWLAGPGAVIVLTSKKHRLWRERRCENCGYEKGPSPGDRCPECGFAWRRPSGHRQT